MEHKNRKLKPNTVFDGGAASVILALDRLTCGHLIVSGNDVETRDRVRAAIRAIGDMLLETVEASYEPERRFKVTVRVQKFCGNEHDVYVTARDEDEAKEKATALERRELGDNESGQTTINAFRAQEVNENWEAK